MSNKNEDSKIWKAVGVMAVIAVVGYYAYNSWQETIDAQVQEQQKADAIEQHNQLMQLRSLGYTTKEDFKNSFGDYTDPSTPCGEWLTAITCTLKQTVIMSHKVYVSIVHRETTAKSRHTHQNSKRFLLI